MNSLDLSKQAIPYEPLDYLTGRTRVPPWFKFKRTRFYAYAFQSILTSATASNEITLDGDSFFLLEGINIITNPASDNSTTLNVQFSDTSKGQPWSIGNLNFRNVVGRGDNTKWFTQPTLLRPSTSVIFTVNNSSTTPVYGTLIGRKVWGLTEREAQFLLRRMWYEYDIFFGPLSASATDTFQVQTYADSEFYLWQMYCSQGNAFTNTQLTAGTQPSDLTVMLRDATSNKNLMPKPTPIRLLAGSKVTTLDTGATPDITTLGNGFRLPIPMVIKRNSTITLEMTNTNASNSIGTTFFNFTLEGCRVFD